MASFLALGLPTFLSCFYFIAVPTFGSLLIHSFNTLREQGYSRTFHAGLSLLFVAGIWELVNELRLIHSGFRIMPLGVLAFYLALATVQGQFFANLFKTAKRTAIAEQ